AFEGLDVGLLAGDRLGEGGLHLVERTLVIAAEEDEGRGRIRVSELGRRRVGVGAARRLLACEFAKLLGELLILLELLDDLVVVLGRLLVLGGVAQEGRERRIVGHHLETMIDPAVERVPLILGLEDRLAAVGEIALLVIFQRGFADRVDDRLLLFADVLCGLLIDRLGFQILRLLLALGGRDFFVEGGVGEEGLQRIIVLLREFVGLVVVAAGAAHGRAENGLADRIHHVGGDLIFALD